MKILKLQSDNTISLSQFTSNLQIPLQLNKQAKVAMKTLSFPFQPTIIEIDDKDSINVSVNQIQHSPVLRLGKYSMKELCDMMTRYINQLINSDDASNEGVEILCDFTGNAQSGYLFNISFTRSAPLALNDTNTELDNILYDNGFQKQEEGNPLFVSSMEMSQFTNIGGFTHTFTIAQQDGKVANVQDSSWFIGMSNYYLGVDANTEEEIKAFFINYIGVVDGVYQYEKDGDAVITDIVPSIGDVITIYKKYIDYENVQIIYSIQQGTNPEILKEGTIMNSENVNSDFNFEDLTLFLKIGEDNGFIKFQNIYAYPTALTQLNNNNEYVKVGSESIRNVKKSLKAVDPVAVGIVFSSELLAKLGFKSQLSLQTATAYKWTADYNVKNSIFDDDLVITIRELGTDGYNHQLKQKESIIMVITAGAVQTSILATGQETFNLSYTDNFPTYLNLGNTSATTYSNLTISARSNNQLIAVNGKMSCTLLFKDESDFELKL